MESRDREMPFTGNCCRNKDRNRKKRRFRAGVLLLLLLLFGDNRVYAQEAAVVFGEEEYSVGEGTFVIDVLLRAEGNIGAYQVSLRYDTDRMEYVSGAEEASEGMITLEGTGFGSEVSYTLEFRTSGAGRAGIAVEEALVYPAEGGEEAYAFSAPVRAAVNIEGEDTGGVSFFEKLDSESQASVPDSGTALGGGIPIVGNLVDAGGSILYIIDMADYEPDIMLWNYTLVTGSYQGKDFTYLSDQARNIRVALMMNGEGKLHLYAYNADSNNFYPVSEMRAEGETFYILSPRACISVPEGISEEEIAAGTVFYAVNAGGGGGYYRYTTSGSLEEWRPENTQIPDETPEGEEEAVQGLILAAAAVFGSVLLVILLVLFGKRGGAFLVKRMKAAAAYFEDKSQYLFVIGELTGREIKRKYARSHLGIVWSVLNPLLMMIVMSMVFSYMFKRSIDNFPLYYLTGSLFWNLFSDGTSHAMSALVDNKSLLLKAKLPRQTFVISRMVTALVNLGYSCIPYVVMLAVFGIRPSWTMLLLPLDIILSFIFAMGIGYILSILYVFFADIRYLYGVFLRILIYLTALFYPVTALPEVLQKIIGYNPVYLSIYIARECMVYGRVPHYSAWVKLILASAVSFFIGWKVFKKKQNDIMQRI